MKLSKIITTTVQFLFISIFLIACNNNDCENFVGNWKKNPSYSWSDGVFISITKDGDNYLIKISGNGTSFHGEYISTCDNGKLKCTLPLVGVSELTFASNSEEFYFNGNKFIREK